MATNEELESKIKLLEAKNESLKFQCQEWKRLSETTLLLLKDFKVGRPKKFKDHQIAEIKKYRLQGKSIKEIAAAFNCSTRTIDRMLAKK